MATTVSSPAHEHALRELEQIKAQTMFKMVVNVPSSDQGCRKVLYMSNQQTMLVARDQQSVNKMLFDGFEIQQPQLVIDLLTGNTYTGDADFDAAALAQLDRFMADVLIPLGTQTGALSSSPSSFLPALTKLGFESHCGKPNKLRRWCS